MARLTRSFYRRPTARVARDLIGKVLCVRTARGVERARIVETEAYLGVEDRACHSFGGRRTERTESMYRDAGHAYVYFIYGMHFCLNFTTRGEGVPEAVLVRAVEPSTRGPLAAESPAPRTQLRTNGPGKLCRHYGITRADDGLDLAARGARIWVEDAPKVSPAKISVSPRVGIDGSGEAKDRLLRYALRGNPYVSGPRGRSP